MLFHTFFITSCLLFTSISQAALINDPRTPNTLQPRTIQTRQTNPSSSSQLTPEEKSEVEQAKIEMKSKLDAVIAAGGKVTPEEISTAVKGAISENVQSDHQATSKAIKTAIESLADKKLSEAKNPAISSPASAHQRRQNRISSSFITSEEKAELARSRAETRAKIDAVIQAGGSITIDEISMVSKQAMMENRFSDRKSLGESIKKAVEDLADEKLIELSFENEFDD